MSQPVKIFIAFSHKDEKLEVELKTALDLLVSLEQATLWDDSNVEAGNDWKNDILKNLLESDIVLLLFSSDALASKYFREEVNIAVERHNAGKAVAIPVILRSCSWMEFKDFSKIEALPEKGRPVRSWPDADEAFNSIFRGVKKVVDRVLNERKMAADALLFDEKQKKEAESARLAAIVAQKEADRRDQKEAAAHRLAEQADREKRDREAQAEAEKNRRAAENAEQARRDEAARLAREAEAKQARLDQLFNENLAAARQYLDMGDRKNARRFVADALQNRPFDAKAEALHHQIEVMPAEPSFFEKHGKWLAIGAVCLLLAVGSLKFCGQTEVDKPVPPVVDKAIFDMISVEGGTFRMGRCVEGRRLPNR